MTEDVLVRLRAQAWPEGLYAEAAEEIERLRTAIEIHKATVIEQMNANNEDETIPFTLDGWADSHELALWAALEDTDKETNDG